MSLALELSEDLVASLVDRVLEQLEERPRWRDLQGTADYLGTNPRYVRYLRERGLPAHKTGRRLLFDLREVDAWLEQSQRA